MQMSLVVRKPWIKSRWNMRAQKCFPWVFSIAFPILKSCVSRLEFCHHKRSFNGFTEKYLVLLRYWCLETLILFRKWRVFGWHWSFWEHLFCQSVRSEQNKSIFSFLLANKLLFILHLLSKTHFISHHWWRIIKKLIQA